VTPQVDAADQAPAALLIVSRPGQPRKLALESSGDYGTLLRVDALDAARHVVAERFPDALAAMLAGSAGTALCTATSDLDIVVFLSGPPAPFRETTRHAGWIVELFVQTPTSYRRFIERETNERRSPLLHMCGEGRLLIDTDAFGATIQDQARHLLEAGPTPLTDQERENRRYALTDQLDDLVGCHDDDDELAIIGARLLTSAAELALLERRRWIGHGKWLLRRLRAADSHLARELMDAYRCLVVHNDRRPLEQIMRRVLDQSGGPLIGGLLPGSITGMSNASKAQQTGWRDRLHPLPTRNNRQRPAPARTVEKYLSWSERGFRHDRYPLVVASGNR
jgi:hypothetical protein